MNRIAVGIIRKPHGVRGEASVEPWTNSPERFADLSAVILVSPDDSETRRASVETSRVHGERALVKFEGIDTPDEIRDLQNWTIEIPGKEARPLEPGEYFLHDLVGMTLIDREGRNRGVVKEAYEGGGGVLLNVKGSEGEFEVPFAEEICTRIDLAAKQITVDLPEGLDDIAHVED